MVMLGASFFASPGDKGSIIESENKKMNHQTLIGGTALFTNPLESDGTYPAPYYSEEDTWPMSGGVFMSDLPIPGYKGVGRLSLYG